VFCLAKQKAHGWFSKRAREERALAAERRMNTLKGLSFFPLTSPFYPSALAAFASSSSASSSRLKNEFEPAPDSETESDAEALETDQDRRRTMLESVGGQELDEMKAEKYDFSDDFRLPGGTDGDSCNGDEAALLTETQASSAPGKRQRVKDDEISVPKKSRMFHTPSSDKTKHQQDGWNCLVCTLYVV